MRNDPRASAAVGAARPRRRVLLVTDWFRPAYKAGGPVRSLANLVDALGSEIDFSVVAGDRDLGDRDPFPGIETGRWYERDGHRVCYLPRGAGGIRRLGQLLRSEEFDILHVNGMYSAQFSIAPLAVVRAARGTARVIVAPRGMLGAGAMRIRPLRKKIYLAAARRAGLFRDVTWHATGAEEVAEIHAQLGADVRVELAPNLPNRFSGAPPARVKRPGEVRFCFFSRISPKKGLREALQRMRALPRARAISFDILGPVDDQAYWAGCLEEIERLRDVVTVTYRGAVEPDEVRATLAGYHLLVLPTWNENYGHAIIDALAAGCPVILSDQTPWRDLEASGAGWTIPLRDHERFEAALRRCVEMDDTEYARRSRAAFEYAGAVLVDPVAIEKNRGLFA